MTITVATIADLTPAQVDLCDTAAVWIRAQESTVKKGVLEIGKRLIAVKQELGHGKFEAWIDREFDWTPRTARNYMKVAETMGAKPEIVSELPLTTVYKMAALPETARVEIIGMITDPAKPPLAAIKAKIAEVTRAPTWDEKIAKDEAQKVANAEKKRALKLAAKSPEAKKAAERRARKQAKEREIFDRQREEQVRRLEVQFAAWIAQLGPGMAAEFTAAVLGQYHDLRQLSCAFREQAASDAA